ncbi:hypothetical protein AB9Q10_16345 [Streptomyces krungchingensis]|uniref:hypothetical protein n=1 Tax=Streptomyces krungchingensis TaxID=1565034 RepID=UPI003CED208E
MGARKQTEEEPEERSRAAGGCILVTLVGVAIAVLFRVSPAVGVLLLWGFGGVFLWRAANRRMSNSSATPPPPSTRTVYAGETGEIAREQKGPGEGLLILYPVREEVIDE